MHLECSLKLNIMNNFREHSRCIFLKKNGKGGFVKNIQGSSLIYEYILFWCSSMSMFKPYDALL